MIKKGVGITGHPFLKNLGGSKVKPKTCVECRQIKSQWWNEHLCTECFRKLLTEKIDREDK